MGSRFGLDSFSSAFASSTRADAIARSVLNSVALKMSAFRAVFSSKYSKHGAFSFEIVEEGAACQTSGIGMELSTILFGGEMQPTKGKHMIMLHFLVISVIIFILGKVSCLYPSF